MAATADGKITSAAREYPRFTSRADRRNMDRLRAQADAVLVGAGTIRADDPPLQVKDPEMREYRRSLGKPAGLVQVLVTASGRLSPSARCLNDRAASRSIVVTVEDAPEEPLAELAPRAEIWRIGRGRVDLPGLLARLRQAGIERLLVEGGGELNWSLVREGLVDEIHITVAPALLGGRDAPTLLEGEGFSMARRQHLRLVGLERVGDEIFCRYAVAR